MKNLDIKTAIVTGASSGIGKATAKMLAGQNVNVVLAARSGDELHSLKEQIEQNGGTAMAVQTDVTNRNQVEDLASQTGKQFGSIDILVNSAGVMLLSYMKKLHVDEWEQMIDVNLKGVLYCVAAVLPVMREQQSGHIINISSVDGRRVYPGGAVYCATKFGVRALTEGLRQELSPQANIRLTGIEPGSVDTPLSDAITDDEIKKELEESHEKMDLLKAGDIADAIRYAVSQPHHVDVSEIQVMPTDQQ